MGGEGWVGASNERRAADVTGSPAGRAPSGRPRVRAPDGAGLEGGGSSAGLPAEPPPALRHPGRAAAGLRAPPGDRVPLAAAGRGSGAAAAGGPGGAAQGRPAQRLPHLRALRAGAPPVAPGPRASRRPRGPSARTPRRPPAAAETGRGAAAAGQASRRRGRWEPEAEGAAGKRGSLQGAPEAAERSRGAAETHYHPRGGLRDAEADEGAGEGEGLPPAGAGAGRGGPELVPPAAPSPAGAPEAAGTKQRPPAGRRTPDAAQPSLPTSAGAEPESLAAALPLCPGWELKPHRLPQPACHSAGPLPTCRATTDHQHAERAEQAPHQGGDGQRPPDHPAGAGEVGPHQAALWRSGRKYQGQQPAGLHLYLASGHQLPLSGASHPPHPRDRGNGTSPMGVGLQKDLGPVQPLSLQAGGSEPLWPAGGITAPSVGKDILNCRVRSGAPTISAPRKPDCNTPGRSESVEQPPQTPPPEVTVLTS